MTMQVLNSAQLVRNAYASFGIINQNDDLSDQFYEDGLQYINEIMAADQASGMNLPFFSQYQFNLIPGQAWYIISQNSDADFPANPIMEIEACSLLYSNLVQYTLSVVRRSELIGYPIALNTQSWPSQILLYKYVTITGDKSLPIAQTAESPNSSVVRFYPVPSIAYPVIIYAKSASDNILKNQPVMAPPHMFRYMRYALGYELTRRYENSIWKDEDTMELAKLRDMFTAGNDQDNSFAGSPTLQSRTWTGPYATNVPYY